MTRRTFAGLLAGTATALAGCGSFASPYDRVVDMVEEAGCDPTGSEPCEAAIRRVAGDDTLLRFPRGRYRLSEPLLLDIDGRLGIVGDGDVRFRPPDGFGGKLLNVHAGWIELRGIDVDNRAPDTAAGLRVVAARSLHVEDIEFHGRGLHSGASTSPALAPAVTSPNGQGVVRNVVATQGSAWAHYDDAGGRIGILVGGRHRGALRIVDCRLEEFGNNGIYANDNTGTVQIEGGVYRNNNVSGIRIGGAGSYVDGAFIEVDPEKYTGPRTGEGSSFNMRGIVVAQKPEKWGWKDAGAEIRNCTIRIAENPSGSSAAIHAWHTARTVTVTNTTIRMDEDNPAIRRDPRRYTGERPSSKGPRWIRCEDVTITGSAAGSPAIRLQDADGSQLRNSSVHQTGIGSDGVSFEASMDCLVDGGRIEATRYPVHIRPHIRPRGRSSAARDGGCVVTFEHSPRLRTTDQWLAVLRDDDTATARLEPDGWLAQTRCLDERTLRTLIEGRNERRDVAITGSGSADRSLVASSIRTPTE